ncbi:crotonyl-CoA carboxylase/reductase [Veronia pacifica]|uniref:Crotonyl-CoA carboxylase/reductase n=1 Tax=Veronia pacifica TaxID=1080227 RepID=A0A1C3EMC7_9GAMM|nr:crotonyl-CoA carboxylase/reductase [Veronia pacifica]ODA34386.1 crotonyl-CoA carboxylase/reductase [Veronia pacifica]
MPSDLNVLMEMIASEHANADDFANVKLPDSMKALVTLREEQEMFVGMESEDKDPRQSLHYIDVPIPEVEAGEVLVAVMASGINYNTVWSSIFEPLSTFQFLSQFAQYYPRNKKHCLDYHIMGSDASGVVVKVGDGVTLWKPGDRVAVNPSVATLLKHQGHSDGVKDPDGRAWGFETNFGGLAQFCLVQETQLMAKPEHLSWEETASLALVSGTAYRMLVSENGAKMKQGDNVLIWGGAGGMGSLGIQYVLNGGGNPVAVVSGEEKAQLARKLGCKLIVDRQKGRYRFFKENGEENQRHLVAFRAAVERLLENEQVDIAYEHTGRETFGASVFVAKRGGKVVTCGSTTGYQHSFDNRYLWMHVKSIIGSHGANFTEAYEANRLACQGKINPVVSDVYTLESAADSVVKVKANEHVGKIGILCLADKEDLGIRNTELREKVGEDKINIFRDYARQKRAVEEQDNVA